MPPFSPELAAAFLDDLPLGLWVARVPSGEVVYVNRAFQRIMGMDKVEGVPIEGAPAAYGIFDREGRPYPVDRLPFSRALASGGSVIVDDLVIHRPDGQKVHVRALANPVRDESTGGSYIAVAFFDISDEVREHEARMSVEQRLAFAIDHAPVILWMINRQGVVTLSEGAALKALGAAPGALVGMSVFDMYRDRPDIVENNRRVLAGESFSVLDEVGGVSLQSHLAPVRGADGEVMGAIGVSTDVTEFRRLEERLFQAQKMEAVGRLAGGIAHDFNNLLGAIQGFASVGHERLPAGDPLRDDLEQILRACDRGALLVRQLLAFGRKQVMKPQVVDVAALILDLQKMLRRVIGENIELETRFGRGVGRVLADPGQLEQVLVNLVVNAREAMPKGGLLTIEAANVARAEAHVPADAPADAQEYVLIAVTDNGVGMDAETQARMFEPFFTTRQGRGSGLGLASVYGIVGQGRGHINVSSQPGQGTTVRVYLPRTHAPLSVPTARSERAAATPGRETVLVAEDDDQIRGLTSRVLRDAGYAVLEASDGQEALQVCREHQGALALLLTDVVMPRMNGVELAAEVRRLRPGVRVAFMSGYSVEAAQYAPLPPDALLIEKPFSPRDLLARLRTLLDGA